MAATVICSICGKEISKRQSLSIGDGKRACREHQETQQAAHQLAAEEKAAKVREQAEKQKAKRVHQEQAHESLKPRCWICQKEGLRQDEFYLRWLIETTKYELRTGQTSFIFDPEEMRKAVGALQGERCLFFVQWNEKNKNIRVPYRTYQMIQMSEQIFGTGTLLVCGECCQEKGFVTVTDERSKNLEFDDLTRAAAAYEVFAKPVVEAIAKTELEAAN